ncbi:transposase [Amycolatopsis mediterranei]|uniref:transposase n=1 Tax=Amycolatopsis mediterranei TaxID=33910 RepID=UPI003443C9B5
MAQRLGGIISSFSSSSPSPTGTMSTLRRQIAYLADEFIGPEAYVVDDTGFPKTVPIHPASRGCIAAPWARRGTVRSGVSVHAVTDWASAAIDWRLFLPESWVGSQRWSRRLQRASVGLGCGPASTSW